MVFQWYSTPQTFGWFFFNGRCTGRRSYNRLFNRHTSRYISNASLMPYALDVIGSVTRLDSLLSYDILGVFSPNCRFKVLSSSKF